MNLSESSKWAEYKKQYNNNNGNGNGNNREYKKDIEAVSGRVLKMTPVTGLARIQWGKQLAAKQFNYDHLKVVCAEDVNTQLDVFLAYLNLKFQYQVPDRDQVVTPLTVAHYDSVMDSILDSVADTDPNAVQLTEIINMVLLDSQLPDDIKAKIKGQCADADHITYSSLIWDQSKNKYYGPVQQLRIFAAVLKVVLFTGGLGKVTPPMPKHFEAILSSGDYFAKQLVTGGVTQ